MAQFFALQVLMGRITIEQVPAAHRTAAQTIIDERGHQHAEES